MRNKKYKFNSKTLSYERVELSVKDKLWKLVSHTLSGLVLAFTFLIITFYFFDTPEERQLKRENENLLHQYKLLNNKLSSVSKVLDNLQERDDNIYRVILEAEPIADNIRKSGIGGVNRHQNFNIYSNAKILKNTTKKLEQLTKQVYIQSKSYDEVIELAGKKEQMFAHFPSIIPIKNENLKRISSGYGMRIHPILKVNKMHYGQDFTAPTGSEVYATGDAKVKKIKKQAFGFGNHIVLDHGYGYETIYAHLSKLLVKKGELVKRGDVIGLVGTSGSSTGPHLHYEVVKNGKKINPVNYYYQNLSAEQYQQIIELSEQPIQSFD